MTKVYIYKGPTKELMKSSSGGAFTALCEAWERKHPGSVYYGAAFDKDMNVVHERAAGIEECGKFRGSKYVRSDVSGVYRQVKQDIANGKTVLFSGTPCQIFAVKKIVGDHPNLFTVDVICHGTPEKKYWDMFRNWIEAEYGKKICEYSFRYKKVGWRGYPAHAVFEDGSEISDNSKLSLFSMFHMSGLTVHSGCFQCPFSNMNRNSDVTIGDYWNISKVRPDIVSEKGVSMILVNTKMGQDVLDAIPSEEGSVLEETEDRTCIKMQQNLNEPTPKPDRYDEFRKEDLNFEELAKKYLGYGPRYKFKFYLKKALRRTVIAEWYRRIKK